MRVVAAVILLAGCATYDPPPPEPPRPVEVPRPATAPPTSPTAPASGDLALPRRKLDDATRRLDRLDTSGARRLLDEAEAALGPSPVDGRALVLWIDIETARAVADLGEGRKDAAERRFRLVLCRRPDAALDPARVPPEVIEVFAAARAKGPTGCPEVPALPGAEGLAARRPAADAPLLVAWKEPPATDGADRAWYRRWWTWVLLGAGAVVAQRVAVR